MEIDGDLEMVGIAVATGALLYCRNLGVQALRHSVSDAMIEIGHYIGQVTSNQLGASIMGAIRLCVAQKYQRCQKRLAQPTV